LGEGDLLGRKADEGAGELPVDRVQREAAHAVADGVGAHDGGGLGRWLHVLEGAASLVIAGVRRRTPLGRVRSARAPRYGARSGPRRSRSVGAIRWATS